MKKIMIILLLIAFSFPAFAIKLNLQQYYRAKKARAIEYAFRIDNFEAQPILLSNIKIRVWFYETREIADLLWASSSNSIESYDAAGTRQDKLDAFNINIVVDSFHDCGEQTGVNRTSNRYADIYYSGTHSIVAGGYIAPATEDKIYGDLQYVDNEDVNQRDDYSSTWNLAFTDPMQPTDVPYVVLYYQTSPGVWEQVVEVQSSDNKDLYTGQEPCNTIAPPTAYPTPYSLGVRSNQGAIYSQTDKLSEVIFSVGSMNNGVYKWWLFEFYKKPKNQTLSDLEAQLIWNELIDFGYATPTGTYEAIGRKKP